jgi:hypothetical protein
MSTNVRKVGYSVPLREITIDLLKEICNKIGQDFDEYDENEFYPNFDAEKHLNKWIIQRDDNNVYGFVKVIDYEYDSFDVVSSMSMNEIMNQLNELLEMLDELEISYGIATNDMKAFTMLYYNGSEEPFEF